MRNFLMMLVFGIILSGNLNPNTATSEQLMLLPGVGVAKAQSLMEARQKKTIQNEQDLLSVKGIGPKLVEKWKPYLIYSGATTLKPGPNP
ncbi:MAG: hypothetical protein A3G32_10030 [Deltaproteobacteria bacterium RIFCSPLOWO2_12_FULL_40_28]|nr:MAG: hypothetical protein A3C45_05040 [Deltaproteobacteria bacterium RIFCSPHIGHO2_02_FULL_40_28]OGQ20368.1 MAG: hypothetical protein A3E27_00420 [Deltaproteobacteria bacterium RIFCSPHIGHO2_12_FULL_40_32]OGQ41337.1 MAG: hypothetical protein A3I69_02070 [Deltaproteobacteria bacterium RIFCSPLOWO2_02_FULL_40_36]OGQ54976.1 MAG: hypothetical protein A3G32_10030 [Deltaproteobacteria bacterium RIFCSPLOWO2_12_FULL_40_28]